MSDSVGFTLRSEYEEGFGGATFAYGPEGYTFDVGKALDEGDGVVVTDNGLLIAGLEGLDGGKGPLLKRVAAGDTPPVQLEHLPHPASSPEAAAAAEAAAEAEAAGAADHADEGGETYGDYESQKKDELLGLAASRGLDVKHDATKADLIKALEAADQKENQG